MGSNRNRSVNVFRRDATNIGDYYCSPSLYFDLGEVETVDVMAMRAEDVVNQCKNAGSLVLGGGGIFIFFWMSKLRKLITAAAKIPGFKTIIWGAGINTHGRTWSVVPKCFKDVNIVGLRDYGTGYPWVPCVSCMSESFDKERKAEHEVVIYDHHDFPVSAKIEGAPRMHNFSSTDIDGVLDFLGSGELVITSSYHGAYWAALLGRKCVVEPFSSKFHYMKHSPVIISGRGWSEAAKSAHKYPEALPECREANVGFYERVRGCTN